jgi:Fe-S cluster biogenesis protein NfuA
MAMTIEQQIEEALDKVRPFIIRDGGNVEFDSFIDALFICEWKVPVLLAD